MLKLMGVLFLVYIPAITMTGIGQYQMLKFRDIETQNLVYQVSTVTEHRDDARVSFMMSPLIYATSLIYAPIGTPLIPWHIALKGGLCSERAWLLVSLMKRRNVPARLVGLSGHVVAEVMIDEKWVIQDPDYGLSFDHNLEYIETHPEIFDNYEFASSDIKNRYVEIFTTIEDNSKLSLYTHSSPRLMKAAVMLAVMDVMIPIAVNLFLLAALFKLLRRFRKS